MTKEFDRVPLPQGGAVFFPRKGGELPNPRIRRMELRWDGAGFAADLPLEEALKVANVFELICNRLGIVPEHLDTSKEGD